MQAQYHPSIICQKNRESNMERVNTYTLDFNLQKDAYSDKRMKLMRKIFTATGLDEGSFNICNDEKSLFIIFTIMESDFEKYVEENIKPLFGDRFTTTHTLLDIIHH